MDNAPKRPPQEQKLLELITDVTHCARCEGDHTRLVFKRFTRKPEGTNFTHWCLCPKTSEPIFLVIVAK